MTNLARLTGAIQDILGTDTGTAQWHAAQIMGTQENMRRQSGETGDNTGSYPAEYGPWSVEPTADDAWTTYRELKEDSGEYLRLAGTRRAWTDSEIPDGVLSGYPGPDELRFGEDDPAVPAERDRLMPQACTAGPAGEGCGGEVPEDGAGPDHLPGCPGFGPWRYIARFTPEVWQGDQAVEVDPLGPREWDATAWATEVTRDSRGVRGQHRLDYLDWLARWEKTCSGPGLDSAIGVLTDDVFKDDPAAPEWVRRHQGPFTIRVRREPRTGIASEQEK